MQIYLIVVSVTPSVNVTDVLLMVVASQAVAPLAPHKHTGVLVKGVANFKVQAVGDPAPVVIVPATSDPEKLGVVPHVVTVDPTVACEFK
jgi:hypothetical protein